NGAIHNQVFPETPDRVRAESSKTMAANLSSGPQSRHIGEQRKSLLDSKQKPVTGARVVRPNVCCDFLKVEVRPRPEDQATHSRTILALTGQTIDNARPQAFPVFLCHLKAGAGIQSFQRERFELLLSRPLLGIENQSTD